MVCRLRLAYNQRCLVKGSRALLASNPTRDNQARAGEGILPDLMVSVAWGLFLLIQLPCHALKTHPVAAECA